jgi:multidrug transporter EmrE-like cation transporter
LSSYYYLFGAIALTVIAQLTLKYAGLQAYRGPGVVFNRYNATAYTLLLVVTVLTVKALQAIPLMVASAWISLTYMLVVIASVVLFDEGQLGRKLVGCAFIVAGVLLFELPL